MASASKPRRFAPRRPVPSDIFTLILLIALVAGVLELLPSNYYMLLPGQARPVEAMIRVQGHRAPRGRGVLYMTDVSLYKVNHKLEEIYGRLNPDANLEPVQAVAGNLSSKQYFHLNAQLMVDSIQEAQIAAFHAVGRYSLGCAQLKPQIVLVLAHTPAAKVLHVGDLIAGIQGKPVCTVTQVSPLIRRVHPREIVSMQIIRGKKRLTVRVPTIRARIKAGGLTPDPHGKQAMLGISMQDGLVAGSIHLPDKVHVNPGNTVGPSAGLMYTLGIIEQLENKDIARGCKVAGTGTVDYQGNVGPIGGAKQKIIAARNAGAQYFLVPVEPDNLGPARAHRGNITVIPVRTVAGALRSLAKIKPCR